jgi:predicted alpha/beta-hydrolase family hydrolase
VSGVWALPGNGHSSWTFIYAPGAGASIKDGFGIFAADRLAASGVATLRFQFPYTEAGRRMVDRPPVLEATWRAAILAAREASPGLVVGGRSMGGRIASQVVAQGEGVDGLALFAYPLHPPGQPDRLRTSHLPQITVPALFCSGTNDAFATPEELQQASTLVPRAQVYMLTGADHSFRIARVTGRRQKDVWDEAVTVFIDWLGSIGPASG